MRYVQVTRRRRPAATSLRAGRGFPVVFLLVGMTGVALALAAAGTPGRLSPVTAAMSTHPAAATPAASPGASSAASPFASPFASPVAPPFASPVATGCGGPASTSTEIAEVFVVAATADDLSRARGCLPPPAAAADWDDIFLGPGHDDPRACFGQPYTVHVSHLEPGLDALIFDFGTPCVVAMLDDWQQSLYDGATLPVPALVVQVEHNGDRWYVRDAFALVPD